MHMFVQAHACGRWVGPIGPQHFGACLYAGGTPSPVCATCRPCRSLTLLDMSWELIQLVDAMGFEVSLLGRSSFLDQLPASEWAVCTPCRARVQASTA